MPSDFSGTWSWVASCNQLHWVFSLSDNLRFQWIKALNKPLLVLRVHPMASVFWRNLTKMHYYSIFRHPKKRLGLEHFRASRQAQHQTTGSLMRRDQREGRESSWWPRWQEWVEVVVWYSKNVTVRLTHLIFENLRNHFLYKVMVELRNFAESYIFWKRLAVSFQAEKLLLAKLSPRF